MVRQRLQPICRVTLGAIAASVFGMNFLGQPKASAQMVTVSPAHPLAIALLAASENGYITTGTMEENIQILGNSGEVQTRSLVTITQEGLLDDSVLGQRFTIQLEKNTTGNWQVVSLEKTWRCRRGANTTTYTPKLCP